MACEPENNPVNVAYQKQRVLGLGAGGHAKVVIDIIQRNGQYEIAGLLDVTPASVNLKVLGIAIIGDDESLPECYHEGIRHAFIGVGSTGDSRKRQKLFGMLKDLDFTLVKAVHPSAVVGNSVTIGEGATIMAGAIINSGARIGRNSIINTGAIVDHDCQIGDHVHVSPGACLSGGVQVCVGAHVGVGATVRENVQIGADSIVGAGAVVIRDVPANMVVVGVPARPLRENVKC